MNDNGHRRKSVTMTHNKKAKASIELMFTFLLSIPSDFLFFLANDHCHSYIVKINYAGFLVGYLFLGTLSFFTAENGGIIDDCIITNVESEKYYLVSNASRAETVFTHIKVSPM